MVLGNTHSSTKESTRDSFSHLKQEESVLLALVVCTLTKCVPAQQVDIDETNISRQSGSLSNTGLMSVYRAVLKYR